MDRANCHVEDSIVTLSGFDDNRRLDQTVKTHSIMLSVWLPNRRVIYLTLDYGQLQYSSGILQDRQQQQASQQQIQTNHQLYRNLN